jgi:hypothetical protein
LGVTDSFGLSYAGNYFILRRAKPCHSKLTKTKPLTPFTRSSKRRRGFPSETHVKRGLRLIHEDKELQEKLGRNDLCPCGSAHRFQKLLSARGSL